MSSVNKNVDDSMIETLLEKLRSCLPKISENGETVRSALSKIYLRVISSGNLILNLNNVIIKLIYAYFIYLYVFYK